MFRHLFMGVLRDPEPGDTGGGGGDKPLSAADIAKLIADSQKELISTVKTLSAAVTELKAKPEKKEEEPPPTPEPDTKGGDPKLLSEISQLKNATKKIEKDLADAKVAREAAEAKARDTSKAAAIKGMLSDFQFANPSLREDAFEILSNKISFDAEGNLVANTKDGVVTAEHFVKTYIESRPSFLAPVPAGGAGSGKGQPTGKKVAMVEDIQIGQSDESRKAVWDALRATQA